MPSFARFVLFAVLISAGGVRSMPSAAQSAESKSEVPTHTNLDGKFERYLESLSGDIDGIVLEDGTVARLAPFKRTTQAVLLRPGDSVRVEGDVVSGLTGPYLVHATVTRIDAPITRGAVSPTPAAGSPGSGTRSRHTGRGAKGSLKDSPRPTRVAGKPRGPSADRSRRVDDILVVQSPIARTRRKGRLETVEAKASEVTTGKAKNGNYSPWSRSQETAGP
jgi:hypothetical protein